MLYRVSQMYCRSPFSNVIFGCFESAIFWRAIKQRKYVSHIHNSVVYYRWVCFIRCLFNALLLRLTMIFWIFEQLTVVFITFKLFVFNSSFALFNLLPHSQLFLVLIGIVIHSRSQRSMSFVTFCPGFLDRMVCFITTWIHELGLGVGPVRDFLH